jgi:hypothetical protein
MDHLHQSPNRLGTLRSRALLAGAGALVLAVTACGASESKEEQLQYGPTTTVTMPEAGPVDTLSELMDAYCENKLDDEEIGDAVLWTQLRSEKNTPHVQPGEVLQTPVAVCDLVQND